jgi:glycosyltransferase involved in cell wall biosynthesis
MRKEIRIIFWVRAGNKYGSLEKYIALFAGHCQERGHSFLLINEIENTSPEYNRRLREAGCQQTVVGESAVSPFKVFSRVEKVIKYWKPDVVQVHMASSLAIPFLKLWRVPGIYPTYHSGVSFPVGFKSRLAGFIVSRLASRVICVSERVRRDEIRVGIQPNKIKTLYLGLPVSDYLSETGKIEEPIPPGYDQAEIKKIITVGRFSPVKGMRFVVEAATDIVKEYPNVLWWLVGKDGPESEYCKRLVSDHNMEEQILFLGQRNDVPALMARAWVQVVGSLSEGLPLMALESSLLGVPTIGTQIGGLDEAVMNGTTGILVEPGSSQALASATKCLLSHPPLRDRLGKEASNYVISKFDSSKLISSLLDIFEEDFVAS